MKIRLAIIETDEAYLKRITTAFHTKYYDKIEVYSFTSAEGISDSLGNVDVVLACEGFDAAAAGLSQRQTFAYLTDRLGVDRIDGYPAICRFQKVDEIYKEILNLYAEVASGIVGAKQGGDGATKVFAFTSPCGGCGTSTAAAACAMHFAARGKRTLYLNLETFGTASTYFSGQGQYSMSDILLALKSKKANLQMKLEGCVRQDASGVFFFCETGVALDQMELENEEVFRLLTELRLSGQYDYIVLDLTFALDRDTVRLYSQMDAVIWVSSGTDIAERKLERAHECIETIDKIDRQADIREIILLCSKGAAAGERLAQRHGLRSVGSLPRQRGANSAQIAAALAPSGVFDQI